MTKTLRTQNKCKDCRYTWYPRGKNLSRMCPSCGSENVGIVVNWAPLLAVAAIGLYMAFGGKSNDSTASSEASVTPTETLVPTQTVDQGAGLAEPAAASPTSSPMEWEEVIEPARTVKLIETEVPAQPAQVQETPVAATLPALAPAPSREFEKYDRVYTDEEIASLEDQKQYYGNDPIVRSRLGIPSRETRKLIR